MKPIYDIEVGEVKAIKIISEFGLIKIKELETQLNEYLRINHIEQKLNIGNIIPISDYEESPDGIYELNAYCLRFDRINQPVVNFKLFV